jgi:hypothetical protein
LDVARKTVQQRVAQHPLVVVEGEFRFIDRGVKHIVWDLMPFRKRTQLAQEVRLNIHFLMCHGHEAQRVIDLPAVLNHEVRRRQRRASRDSMNAMNQHAVSVFQAFVDKAHGLLDVSITAVEHYRRACAARRVPPRKGQVLNPTVGEKIGDLRPRAVDDTCNLVH